MIKDKHIISSISGRKQFHLVSSSSLMKQIVMLSEILNTTFLSFFSILSQVVPKYSSQLLLPILPVINRLLPEAHNFFNFETTLSQVVYTHSSQILLPSSSQNNRILPEIKNHKH